MRLKVATVFFGGFALIGAFDNFQWSHVLLLSVDGKCCRRNERKQDSTNDAVLRNLGIRELARHEISSLRRGECGVVHSKLSFELLVIGRRIWWASAPFVIQRPNWTASDAGLDLRPGTLAFDNLGA